MMYEVWTINEKGELGTLLCNAMLQDCEARMEQEIEKGADPKRLLLRKQPKYVITRKDKPGMMFQGLGIDYSANKHTGQTKWTTKKNYAYKAVTEGTAQTVIDFIRDVIDWELAEQLTVVPMEEGRD